MAGGGDVPILSPVAADRAVYIVDNDDDDVCPVKAGTEYELLATNKLEQTVMFTPAIAEDYLLFRTLKNFIAIFITE